MDSRETKRTVPVPSVGADGEQPISQTTIKSIAEETAENNPQEESLEEMLRDMRRMSDSAYLHTVSMNDLYQKTSTRADRPSLTVCSTLGHTSLRERPRWASRS